LVTKNSYHLDADQLVSALDELPVVLVEGFGMKLSVPTAIPKYDSYLLAGDEAAGLDPRYRRVALDVSIHHLPEYRNTLMVFGVERYDAAEQRLLGQLPPDVPPIPSQMATAGRRRFAGVGYNVYTLFGILGRLMYGGLELHLVCVCLWP